MAITRCDYEIFKRIRQAGLSRPGSSLLELGEAEWYGDVPAQTLLRDIKAYGTPGVFLATVDLLHQVKFGNATVAAWALSKMVYEAFLGMHRMDSIDLHGSEHARKLDLNRAMPILRGPDEYLDSDGVPIPTGKWRLSDDERESIIFDYDNQYNVVYNTGTAEHVFNIGRVLEFIHDVTKLGGLMIHCFPLSGLLDHGFWTVNPVMVFCLARANLYEILYMTVSQIDGALFWLDPARARESLRTMVRERTLPSNSWLHVVYRKASDAAFKIPTQEIYTECPDPEIVEAWREMR